jgi:hypothetical protein
MEAVWLHSLVSLGSVFERREDVGVGTTLDTVYKVGNFAEEG